MKNIKMIKKEEIYESLTPVQQVMVQILGVNVCGLKQDDLHYIIETLGLYDENNKSFTKKKFRLTLNELVDKKLVIKKPVGVVLDNSFIMYGFEKALGSDLFLEMVKLILEKEPLKKKFSDFYETKSLDEYKRLIHQGFVKSLDISFEEIYFSAAGKLSYSILFYDYFTKPFNPFLLDQLPVEKRYDVIKCLFIESELRLCSPLPIIDYACSLMLNHPKERSNYLLLPLLFLCGKINEIEKILNNINDESSYIYCSLVGLLKSIRGENEDALSWFYKSLNLLKKESGKRKVFLTGLPSLFFILSLLRSDETDDHKNAINYIDILKKQFPALYDLCKILLPLFQERIGETIKPSSVNGIYLEGNHAFYSFFETLAIAWTDMKNAKNRVSMLKKMVKKAKEAGYKWLEAELSGLLAYLGNSGITNEKKSLKIHEECGTKTIIDIILPTKDWEKKLKALISIGSNDYKSLDEKVKKKERLVWILEHSIISNNAFIKPRLQTLSKNGTWTKGRAVSLKTLYDNFTEIDYLSDHDKKICSSIKVSSYSSSYYYSKAEYYFSETKSLEALVGHPLIFTQDNLETPVEFVKGEPEIRIKKEKRNFILEINPIPKNSLDDIFVFRETPSRFKLIKFNPQHKDIAALIGKDGVSLPKEAEKMVIKAASSISSIIAINSDFDIGVDKEIVSIDFDPVPNIHLMPWQDGIVAEILVRPFGDKGSYFKPGRGGINVFAEIEGKKVQTSRDFDKENELLKQLLSSCKTFEKIDEVSGQWLVGDPEDALELLLEIKEFSNNNKVKMKWPKGETMKIENMVSFDNLNLNIKKRRDWFDVTGSIELDKDTTLDLNIIMELLDDSVGRFIRIDEKKFLAITSSLKERLEELRSYSNPLKKGVKLNPVAALAVEEFFDEAGAKKDKAWKDHCKKLKEVKEEKIPATLQAELRDYQEEGFSWLSKLANWNMGACLADDMGLGKTIQAISAILLNAKKGPSLVVAPVSVISNWEDECKKFAPTLNPLIFGAGDRKEFLEKLEPFDIVFSSYGLLQTEGEKLKSIDWETIVLDEAQAIKNMKAKRTKAAMELKSNFRIITTGTPVENHLDELWTLFNFINPGLLGSFKRFRDVFALPIERDNDKKASKRLKKLIRPFILRRMKTDVLKELPEKTEITLSVEMEADERKIYEAQRLKAIKKISESSGDNPGEKHLKILAELTKLRQICCNPSLVLPGFSKQSSKLNLFKEIVGELIESKHKVLVFSQFTGHLKIIRDYLDNENISYQYLDGSTSAKKRKDRINAFQGGEGDLFLISLKAGGFGLNLTAADYVIHMDPWWNPAVEDQASDRAHRIGQTRPVTIYRLVVKDSIEEKIINLHKEKRALAQSLLEGSDASGKILAEDLLNLLRED